jgi:ketosteroid isomerase-like protein
MTRVASHGGRLGAALLVLASLLPGLAVAQDAGPDTVARAYESARRSSDLDALLALFADDAVITDRLGYKHAGTAEIRRLLQIASSRGQALAITERRVSGDHVSWVEQAATPDLNFAFAVDAIVQGGRIRSLVYRDYGPAGLGAEPSVVGTLVPAPLGLVVPLLVLTVATIILSVPHPGAASRSRGRTALLAGLRQWQQTRQPPEPSSQA